MATIGGTPMSTIRSKLIIRNRNLKWLRPTFINLGDAVERHIKSEEIPPYWDNEAAPHPCWSRLQLEPIWYLSQTIAVTGALRAAKSKDDAIYF
jgi:hypothetical protein